MRFGVFFLLAVAVGVHAQKPAPSSAQPSFPITSLKVEGNRLYTSLQIIQASGLKIGQPIHEKAFDAARERLLALGAFNSVGLQFGPDSSGVGFSGVIQVSEVEQVFPYSFEELPVPDAELRAMLRKREPMFTDKIPGTPELLARFAAHIQETVKPKGFTEEVVGRVIPERGDVVIVFRPSHPRATVAEVRFLGTKILNAQQLQSKLAGVAFGSIYSEPEFRQLLDINIRPMYEAIGYVRMDFTKLVATPAKEADGVVVTVTIHEGSEYKLGLVGAKGTKELSSEEMGKLAKLKSGDTVNFDDIKAAQERIVSAVRKLGYLRVTSKMDRVIHDNDHTVDVYFLIQPGPVYTFGKLIIEGLDIHTEPAIRKMWGVQAGRPFNRDYPDYFLARLREDGVFENLGLTRSESKVDDSSRVVDVTLVFTGKPLESEKKKPLRDGPLEP